MNKKLLGLFCVIFISVCSCSKDDSPPPTKQELSSDREIISFKFTTNSVAYEAIIDQDTISLNEPLPSDASLKFVPVIEVSDKATINPKSGISQDFSQPIKYTVTAEDGKKKEFTAYFTQLTSENKIVSFEFTNLVEGESTSWREGHDPKDIDTIYYRVPYSSPVKELIADIKISEKANIVPESGISLDYSTPVKFSVTAEDGAIKEYLVIVEIAELPQVSMSGLYEQTINKEPNDNIGFYLSTLNPIKDSLKVKLRSGMSDLEYDLEIQDVDLETRYVTAKLPERYLNGRYNLEVFIEHDNFVLSDSFLLLKGDVNFLNIHDEYTTLIMAGETFYVEIYLDESRFQDYSFYLRKNNIDYPFISHELFNSRIKFNMPDVPEINIPENGTDFELVVRDNTFSKEYLFNLINQNGELVNVYVPKPTVITSINKYVFKKGEVLTIYGENLLFPVRNYNEYISTQATLQLFQFGPNLHTRSNLLNANGSISFTIHEHTQAGTYKILFKNNILKGGFIEHDQLIKIVLSESEHPQLYITEAKLYNKDTATFGKQLLFKFNESIEDVFVDRIEFDFGLVIESYIEYPTTILTGKLTDEDYTSIGTNRYRDGNVILKHNGVEYKLPFSAILE
jgi:hypothetical protein